MNLGAMPTAQRVKTGPWFQECLIPKVPGHDLLTVLFYSKATHKWTRGALLAEIRKRGNGEDISCLSVFTRTYRNSRYLHSAHHKLFF